MRVLIIENCVAEGDSLRRGLVGAGHEAEVSPTPQEAFVLAKRFQPQVVTSALFSLEDDQTWWRKLREHPALAETRFIAAVEHYDAASVATAHGAGFHYVLAQPVDARSLEQYLVEVPTTYWRREAALQLTPPVHGVGALATPRYVLEDGTAEAPEREALAEFLRAMQELATQQRGETGESSPASGIPPVALLRFLDTVQNALRAAREGDTTRGHRILREGLSGVGAPPFRPWSDALSARYQLALRTYSALQQFGYPRPDYELP